MKWRVRDIVRVLGALAVFLSVMAYVHFRSPLLLAVAGAGIVLVLALGGDGTPGVKERRDAEDAYLEAHPADRELLKNSSAVERQSSWGIIIFGLLAAAFANVPRWDGMSWAIILWALVGVIVVCIIINTHSKMLDWRVSRSISRWSASQSGAERSDSDG